MSIVDDVFEKVTTGFDFKKLVDRLRGAYVRRRATYLHTTHETWNTSALTTALERELQVVAEYVTSKGRLIDETDDIRPSHLDLALQAVLTTKGIWRNHFVDSTAKGLLTEFRANRASWISQIVWRAAALHSEVWKSVGSSPVLHAKALDQLLDHRLHAVEQMHCNVNSSGYAGLPPRRSWDVAGPHGPWRDGYYRNFEYPMLPRKPFAAVLQQMPEWQKSGETLVFDPPNHVVTHVPTELNAAWKAQLSTGGTGWIVYKPSTSRKPADVIIRMCENPREDFLDRSWLLCDMVGSVVQISSLWLANHRRHGNDDAFTAVMNRTNPDGSPYISLGPVIQFDGKHDLDILMCDDQDPFFENVDLELNDLQVGDFVCFWNGRIYNLLSSGAWRNEFSYVMGIDVDGRTGNVRVLTNGPQIFLAGHGVHTKLYNAMAAELAAILNVETFLARFVVEEKVRATPGLREVSLGPQSKAVLWSPYESFDAPGAWWVEIPPEIWNKDWSYPTIDDVLKAVPRTIAKEAGGAGYVNPPRGDAVYFPLYEPAVAGPDGDSWRAYLRQRKANASFRPPSELKHLTIDGRIALGLFYRGPKTKFPVVRPRVRG